MKKAQFDELIESVRQAGQVRRGKKRASRRFVFKPADIRGIRERLDLSQAQFALLIGISVSTLQNWEQGRREPEGPARALLRVADRNPEVLLAALTDPKRKAG
ncbi:MAG: helix-turn-helix domain-containing protein [Candidatus Hydrogenedentes bacterium]|nr:helix-turn-helix domain-containing protein [Candidatus Hydrogenedentota bacterium]